MWSIGGGQRSHPPGALKKAEGGEIVGRFEEIGFGWSLVKDAEAVDLHSDTGSVSHRCIWSAGPDDLI